jgi:Dienelactone hydrolase family
MLVQDCFGGTGVVDYAFADVKDVKAVVPFHGGLTSLAPIQTEIVYPYILVQSGGEDDAHGNNTELELMLNGGNATWEISRYSSAYIRFQGLDKPKSDRIVLTDFGLHYYFFLLLQMCFTASPIGAMRPTILLPTGDLGTQCCLCSRCY